MAKSVRLHIKGHVQGVFYRAWTVEQARARGLTGWVRNLRDGSVEALFSGDGAQVDDMVRACTQGPPAARVADITLHADHPPVEDGFHQLPTV
jgi:acylphosphatase